MTEPYPWEVKRRSPAAEEPTVDAPPAPAPEPDVDDDEPAWSFSLDETADLEEPEPDF